MEMKNRSSTVFHRMPVRSVVAPCRIVSAPVCVAAMLVLLLGAACGTLRAQKSPSTVNLRIIVVASAPDADRILKRLKGGEDFATVAREVSVDPTASDGGSMGAADPATLRSELRDAVKGLAAGQISNVVRLPSGYAILKVATPGETDALQNTSPARILSSSATGAIRYSPNVGGKGEADLGFRNFSKPGGWSQDLHGLCRIRQESLASVIDYVQKSLNPSNPQGVAHGRP